MIKELRQQRGLTQQELADRAEMHIRQIQKIEAGETLTEKMTLKNALSLARALGIPVEQLIPPNNQ